MSSPFYQLRQENYLKPPSAEMRKVFNEAWLGAVPLPGTRIDAHLKIKETLADPVHGATRKAQLKVWRAQRKQARIERARQRQATRPGDHPHA